ncbi:MAG: hypothetical protein HQM16_10810 [Deltaproteobacteria bacterium]|nr:hypothetical protein [Deltaproteobacteria bacterium]
MTNNGENWFNRYTDWETKTKRLCEFGSRVNQIISQIYEAKKEITLLNGQCSRSAELVSLMEYRRVFWSQHKVTEAKAVSWCRSFESAVQSSIKTKDRLGLFRELVWAIYSTLPIIQAVRHIEKNRGTGIELVRMFEKLVDEKKFFFSTMTRTDSNAIYLHRHDESSDDYIRKWHKKKFFLSYRIDRALDTHSRYVQLVEEWKWQPTEQITLCVPISVGCQNRCRMCNVGTFFGGNLTAEEIIRLINMNFSPNNDVPIAFQGQNITIYYLGGGDACLNSEMIKVLQCVWKQYPNIKQIVSTIGIRGGCIDGLMKTIMEVPDIGFQMSLCSLDDSVRGEITDHLKGILTVKECINYLEEFYRLTGRKGYASLMLFVGLSSDLKAVAAAAKKLLDPVKTHIALTVVRRNNRPLSKEGLPLTQYAWLRQCLSDAGFEVSMSSEDDESENNIACGCADSDILLGNTHFKKQDQLLSF